MGKKLALLLAALGFIFQVTACTSSSSSSEEATPQDMESVDGANADHSATAGTSDTITEDQLAADPNAPAATEPGLSDQLTETTTTETKTEPTQDLNAAAVENTTTSTDAAVTPAQPPVAEVAPAPAPEAQSVIVPPTEEPKAEAPKRAGLEKIQNTPWQAGDVWVNAVYFAKPGDTLGKISKKIYGKPKVSLMKKMNPGLMGSVRAGDAVYYNSPVRPDDSLRMLTYYEDNGQTPETYVAKEGDSLKKVSKKLLGYDAAWKEVWALNLVESKNKLAAGTELRYWKTDLASAPMASDKPSKHHADHAEQAVAAGPTPEEMAAAANAGQVPPPPPMPDQAASLPPPPPPSEMAPPAPPTGNMPPPPPSEPMPPMPQAGNELAPPPPPPPVEAVPPMEPKPKKKAAAKVEDEAMNQDNIMALAAIAIVAGGAVALIIVRRKRKQKELEAAFNDTQVG